MGEASILIVDDDDLAVSLLKHYLQAAGFTVEVAANGRVAMEHILATPPRLVVLDAMMPVMGGFELVRRLSAMGKLQEIKVAMNSARALPQHVEEAAALGVHEFFAKPYDPLDLVSRVKRLLAA